MYTDGRTGRETGFYFCVVGLFPPAVVSIAVLKSKRGPPNPPQKKRKEAKKPEKRDSLTMIKFVCFSFFPIHSRSVIDTHKGPPAGPKK